MKAFSKLMVVAIFFAGCSDNLTQDNEFTGNEVSYELFQASDFPVSGTVTFKERTDHSTQVIMELTGTNGEIFLPVHLHFGDINTPDAQIAVYFTPVYGQTGRSETRLATLADESPITYQQLIKMDASVKVHLSADGDGANIILAAGNIGSNGQEALPNQNTSGRVEIPVCRSY